MERIIALFTKLAMYAVGVFVVMLAMAGNAKLACADIVTDLTTSVMTQVGEISTTQETIVGAALVFSVGFLVYVLIRKSLAYGKKS